MSHLLYLLQQDSQYQLNRRPGGNHSQTTYLGQQKTPYHCQQLKPKHCSPQESHYKPNNPADKNTRDITMTETTHIFKGINIQGAD